MQPIPSQKTINLIKSFESYRSEAYLDVGGVPTIGWGTTKGIKLGMKTTPEQAEAWIRRDVAEVEDVIIPMIRVSCSENEICALISFAYNVGIAAFSRSTLLKKLNSNDKLGAAQEFIRWDHVDGREIAGLLERRTMERDLFLTQFNTEF